MYKSINLLSYSPVAGVRCASTTEWSTLQDLDSQGPLYRQSTQRLAQMTQQEDPALRLMFALWALDSAPSPDLKALIPLEMFILHYVRTTPAWGELRSAPALNVVVLDWPFDKQYEFRTFLVGADGPMSAEELPYFYEARREEAKPEIQARMPAPRFP